VIAPAPRKFLFVCTGNICRSPVAQFLAERLAEEAGLPWRTASAGVAAEVGWAMEAGAVRALAARGIVNKSHAARQLDAAMMDEAHEIYALTRAHRDTIVSRFPKQASKVAVLREAAGLPGPDVFDPYGMNDAAYERCTNLIEEALNAIIQRTTHANR